MHMSSSFLKWIRQQVGIEPAAEEPPEDAPALAQTPEEEQRERDRQARAERRQRAEDELRARYDALPLDRCPVPAANVSQVPQRSPLRYPGGKTWLIPHARKWLGERRPRVLLEPYAGGATIALTAAAEGLAGTVVIAEADPVMHNFWRHALSPDGRLPERVAEITTEAGLTAVLDTEPDGSSEDAALRALVLNRVRHGGVMTRGASVMRSGEGGKGLTSRWYPATLSSRLGEVRELASQGTILLRDGTGEDLIREYSGHGDPGDVAAFLDPPYMATDGTSSGRRLYDHSDVDHAALFFLVQEAGADVLMTYEWSERAVEMAWDHGMYVAFCEMRGNKNTPKRELVITSRKDVWD